MSVSCIRVVLTAVCFQADKLKAVTSESTDRVLSSSFSRHENTMLPNSADFDV